MLLDDIGSGPGSGASLSEIVGDYCRMVSAINIEAEFSTQLKHYSHLLFNCICVVALKSGMPLTDVDNITRRFVEKAERSSRYMSRLRSASKWVAQQCEALEDKMQHRASELFFLCKTSSATDYTSANGSKGGVHSLNTVPSSNVLSAGHFSLPRLRKSQKCSGKMRSERRVSFSRRRSC